jgi:Sulfotransferase domain
MRVIGAGLPRTATLSQKLALEILGVGPCYHMVDVLSDLGRVPQWTEALEGQADWDEIFAGYDSTVDWPGSFFHRELMDRYPDAKVLLSVRPAESWARSMQETICGILYGDTLMRDLSSARGRVDPDWASYISLMDAMWRRSGLIDFHNGSEPVASVAAVQRYNDEVAGSSDRVFVWSAADGWEPLCEFLEVPVPDQPFPHVNDAGMFAERIVESALAALTAWRANGCSEPS